MQPRTSALTLNLVCILLIVSATVTMPIIARPAHHGPPYNSGRSEQTMTMYVDSVAKNRRTPAMPIFTSHGTIGPASSWLRDLARPEALEPGTVTVIDEEFRGAKEFGLPLAGRLQGVFVTGQRDGRSHMVAMKALFAGEDAGSSLRFFGICHDGLEESHITVVGGTGRYDSITGFAVLEETDPPAVKGDGNFSKGISFRVYLK